MKISIIIPSFNGRTLLGKYLPFVIQAAETWDPSRKNWELIIVDDASTDGTSEWLRQTHPKIQIIHNLRNVRFGESCNRGVDAAKGDVIVLLNNDVQPKPDFLIPLMKHFSDPSVFAVGCREVNRLKEKEVFGGRGVMAFMRGFVVHWRPKDQESHDTLWVSAGSAAYRRDLWVKLGGFDRLFRPAYEEDRDLCWRALKAGYRLVFEPKAQVRHDHETTNIKAFGRWQIALFSLKNQLLFVWKNLSGRYLLSHLFWLPYHLVLTTIRTRGIFLLAFLFALLQLPEAFMSRRRASVYWKRSDEEILSMAPS